MYEVQLYLKSFSIANVSREIQRSKVEVRRGNSAIKLQGGSHIMSTLYNDLLATIRCCCDKLWKVYIQQAYCLNSAWPSLCGL